MRTSVSSRCAPRSEFVAIVVVMFSPHFFGYAAASDLHRRNLLGQHQLRLSRGDHLLNGNPGTGFDERCAATRKADHGHFGNDKIDGARGRQRALVQDLRLALGSMLHGDDNAFGTSHKVHRPAVLSENYIRTYW